MQHIHVSCVGNSLACCLSSGAHGVLPPYQLSTCSGLVRKLRRLRGENEDPVAPIGETSTTTSCQRPDGKEEDIFRKFCWVVGGDPGDLLQLTRGILEIVSNFGRSLKCCVYKIPDFVIIAIICNHLVNL